MALGLGMKVIAADSFIPQVDIKVTFFDGQSITTTIVSQPLNLYLKKLTLLLYTFPLKMVISSVIKN
jgi:D-3-phosphoglycerate dehydrogenase